MRKLLSTVLLCCLLAVPVSLSARKRYIMVKPGDAQSLLEAISKSSVMNADSMSERLFILIPDGFYDLGETVLTTIWGHNVALIGQSMEGTIIRNCPPVEKEGIGTTAVFLNRGVNTYVQDLTLRNDLDYYHSGAAGRAVCWQDKGNRVVFKRVRMLSYQDTYYSHSEECQHYFEDSEIHGTVDFICGAGDVYFNRCLIVTEKREANGHGRNVIVAPRTSTTNWGYVFRDCTIRNDVSTFHYARGWHTHPRCTWINTILESPEKLEPERFDPQSIRSEECEFGEYGTVDLQGHALTPDSNVITLHGKEGIRTVQTTLSADSAARFTLRNVFPDWQPDQVVRRLEKQSLRLARKHF
ncbi:MAG: hypothetical protein J5797_09850 [Prevotella sp.]|nr:hypothetical protein [Prevotella sp.]